MRLLLKLSGEAFAAREDQAFDADLVQGLVAEVGELLKAGHQLAVVLGGGNLVRGATLKAPGVDRVTADHMGMLATLMNGLAFRASLTAAGVPAALFNSLAVASVADGYSRSAAEASLESGKAVVLAGGTGNPFFTTDTAACLRGIELGCDAVLKATKVDGIYSADPMQDPTAERFATLTYEAVLERRLGVMDLPAIHLCQEHNLPIVVFSMQQKGALTAIAEGDKVGTRVDA